MLIKYLKVIPAAEMALLLVSCIADEEVVSGRHDVPVTFASYAPVIRGAVVDTDSLERAGIGVFAFYQKARSNGYPMDFNKYTGEPTFMYNQKLISTDGTTWTYTPRKYWPNNKGDQLSFFAYAPYDSTAAWEDLKLFTNLKGDKFTRRYVMEDAIGDQRDILWVSPVLNMKKPSDVVSTVQFNFRHLCSRLSVSVVADTAVSNCYATVDTVSIRGDFLSSGKVNYVPANDSLYWTDLGRGGMKIYDIYEAADNSFLVGTQEKMICDSTRFMFVIPGIQDVTLSAVLTQHYASGGPTRSYTITKTFASLDLQGGRAYNFLLNVRLRPISFVGSVDAVWNISTTIYTSPDNGSTWN